MGYCGGRQRLGELIKRYRPQIRADLLSEYGVDLAEWYVAGRWVALLELLDMLPRACRLNEALAQDPELAAAMAELPEPKDTWRPSIAENNLTAMTMALVLDAVKDLKQTIIASVGGKPSAVKPFPTPRTALQKYKADQERRWAEEEVMRWGFDASDI